jgi:general transcription factor 3C polypeptide 1
MAIPCRDHENIIELSKADITKRDTCKLLAIANALELLKVFFLSSSLGSEAQAALIATFQLYSESEIFTALSFLREKNFMVSMCILSVSVSNLFCLFLFFIML